MHAGLAVHGFAEIHPVWYRALGADGAGIVDRHVDVLALARSHAVEQRDGDGVQHKRTAHVPGLIALAANRRDGRIGIPRARHCAAQREMRGIVHLQIVPRPILPEVGERGVNQALVPHDRGVIELHFRERAGRRAFEKHIGTRKQPAQHILRRLACEVERDTLLAGVVKPVVEAGVGVGFVLHKRPGPAAGTAIDRLDLNHARAAIR